MANWLSVIILAAAQGVAEFLPVSSSGHLLVLGNWFGFDAEANMTLNVVLHAGTLLAIVVFYFKHLLSILLEKKRRRLIALVIAGSVPAAVVGVGLKLSGWEEKIFSSPWVAAIGFIVTATVLGCIFGFPGRSKSEIIEPEDALTAEKLSFGKALLIGCAQAVAITPGISRSGSTISAGVLCRMRKSDAAEFSFLLAIPAIGGAALLELLDFIKNSQNGIANGEIFTLSLGFVVSAIVGYAALAGLIALLKKGKLGYFSYYLYIAALIVLVVETVKYC